MQERVGPYRIVRKLGEGGMGIVYAAEDERLHRSVAIKTIREAGDDTARDRFFREARAAASVSHPNVCQLFDIGDAEGCPFIVMELLQGESLADRLKRGPLPLPEAMQSALSILTALEALHARGFIHRDLKPSNVFLTAHGVKLLDFGLARELRPAMLGPDASTLAPGAGPLTQSGMIVGTPRYMAPEQVLSAPVDHRADIFAAGVLLFEMISGKPPFDDANAMSFYHALVYEHPPNLGGSAAISALNRIVHRALAKQPDERYQSAAAMSKDIREVMLISDAGSTVAAHRITRLIVLPFRILRPDPETDFLALALPEAITTSLASIGSLVVRSSAAAARFGGSDLDLRKLAAEADVDVTLTGTLLRAGDQIRATTQLVQVPEGSVLWSLSSQARMSDLFELQDTLTQRIVESLQLPLTDREARLVHRDVPATPRAHEFYLRAGQQAQTPEGWVVARELYQRAVEEDPQYAPAWARLARIHLLIGKYGGSSDRDYTLAESAVRHALDLNPDLPLAHSTYAQIDAATGRAEEGMLQLLDQVQRGSNDPNVFSGLCMACRYCGLLEASAAAHEQARQLDPGISTSAAHTYWMLGRYEDALAAVDMNRDFGDAAFIYESMGQVDEAIAVFDDRARRLLAEGSRPGSLALRVFEGFRAAIELRAGDAIRYFEELRNFPDPEGRYYIARAHARVGAAEEAIQLFDSAERGGFFCYPFFARDSWLDSIRNDPRTQTILRRAESRMHDAERRFAGHPGSRVLMVGGKR